MKRTEWYPSHIKPVRKGLYEVGSDKFHVYAYWDEKHWRLSLNRNTLWLDQNLTWRGITNS